MTAARPAWPALPLEAWSDTHATLHLWLQIVGKIRLVQSPWVNHSWHVTLYVTPLGLTTSPIPDGTRSFEITFDFTGHRLVITASDGQTGGFALEPQPVADFYRRLMRELGRLGIEVRIHPRPNEVAEAIPFERDEVHRAYDGEYAQRYARILGQADRVFKEFRARFIGKCSPVHFFWGAPDLAVTRFSGRPAPVHPGGVPNLPDRVVREAYSHEVSSCGFWAGGGPLTHPAFYAYAYPEPGGFASAAVKPAPRSRRDRAEGGTPEFTSGVPDGAYYNNDLKEFILPYDVVRTSGDPDQALLAFLQSTYEAAADLAGWDRQALEWAGIELGPGL